MSDAIPNPVAPSRAHACNALSRALASKHPQSRLALVGQQTLPGCKPQDFVTPPSRSALPNILRERNRPIQIP
jgi:hypothetical protein